MSGVLNRTVAEASRRATELLLTTSAAERDGFLQAVHPVGKVVGLFALVVIATVTDRALTLVALIGLAVGLAVASRVSVRTLVSRAAPPALFSLVVVAPQAASLPGPVAASLALPVGSLALTTTGIAYVASFTLRVTACVGFLSLLLLTTRFSDALGALARLRVPATAITLIAVTHRYLLVFFRELTRATLARRSRTFAPEPLRTSWRRSGSFLGSFFLRTLERGERVQRSARARGGTTVRLEPRRRPLGAADAVFGCVVAVAVLGRVLLG